MKPLCFELAIYRQGATAQIGETQMIFAKDDPADDDVYPVIIIPYSGFDKHVQYFACEEFSRHDGTRRTDIIFYHAPKDLSEYSFDDHNTYPVTCITITTTQESPQLFDCAIEQESVRLEYCTLELGQVAILNQVEMPATQSLISTEDPNIDLTIETPAMREDRDDEDWIDSMYACCPDGYLGDGVYLPPR